MGPWKIAPIVCSSFGSSAQALKLLLVVIHPRDVAFAPVSCIFPQGNPHSSRSRTLELKACKWCMWLKARPSQSSGERGSTNGPQETRQRVVLLAAEKGIPGHRLRVRPGPLLLHRQCPPPNPFLVEFGGAYINNPEAYVLLLNLSALYLLL